MADLLILGAGLIGTSLGLALRETHDVALADVAPGTVERAVQRGAGRAWDATERARLAVVCVPPRLTGGIVVDVLQRDVADVVTHVASVQAPVQAEIEAGLSAAEMGRVCGGHPLAGRERSGPDAATGQLFTGRTWAVCPSESTCAPARTAVVDLAAAVGAHPVELTADAHDRSVALVSHLPQIAASALAARLVDGPDLIGQLAGPGLQDSTRVAASDVGLWTDILCLNAGNLAELVANLAADLQATAQALAALDSAASPTGVAADRVADLLRRGVAGRERVPVKRGERDADFVVVAVSVVDAPGELARLLTAAGDGGINVEDVHVEHAPDTPRGVIELLVRPAARSEAAQVLRAGGWDVLGGS